MNSSPFALTDSLIPVIVARLAPIADLGMTVQGLPDNRKEAGFVANDAVTLAWAAWAPLQGQGNSVSGLSTHADTLNCRITAARRTLRNQAADLLFQRLTGWEVMPGNVLQWGGAEIIPPGDNDASYRLDVRFALVMQSRPPRVQ
jgi:hypothetical protein